MSFQNLRIKTKLTYPWCGTNGHSPSATWNKMHVYGNEAVKPLWFNTGITWHILITYPRPPFLHLSGKACYPCFSIHMGSAYGRNALQWVNCLAQQPSIMSMPDCLNIKCSWLIVRTYNLHKRKNISKLTENWRIFQSIPL